MKELFILIAIILLILTELILDSICLLNLDKIIYLVFDIIFWNLLSVIELIYFIFIKKQQFRESTWKKNSTIYFLLTLFSICSFICYELIHISDIESNKDVSDKCLYQKYQVIALIMYIFEGFMCFHLIYISFRVIEYIKLKNNISIDLIEKETAINNKIIKSEEEF